jgi:transposase
MRQKSVPGKEPATQVVKNIRRATRRHFSAEDKIRIVLEGLRGEDSIAELCRRERIVQNLYYRWSKDFLEAGKKRLAGDTARVATSDEVKDLRREASALKEVVAELTLENRLLKKGVTADGEDATWGTPPPRSSRSSGKRPEAPRLHLRISLRNWRGHENYGAC